MSRHRGDGLYISFESCGNEDVLIRGFRRWNRSLDGVNGGAERREEGLTACQRSCVRIVRTRGHFRSVLRGRLAPGFWMLWG